MKTVEELGRLVKEKYPGKYDDMSDAEVGRAVKARYPQYSDYSDSEEKMANKLVESVLPSSLTVQQPSDLESWRNPPKDKTESNVESLTAYYDPNKGRLSSWWRRGKAESRVKLLSVLNEEQYLVIQQGAMLEEAVRNGKKSKSDYERYLAQNAFVIGELKAKATLIVRALQQGYTVETDQHLKVVKGESQVRVSEEEARSGIKVKEHQQLQAVDLKVRWEEIQQDLKMADEADTAEQTIIKNLRGELADAKRERFNLKNSDEPEDLKKELLRDYKIYISHLEAHIHEREIRRLQNPPQGKSKGRSSKAPTAGTDYPPESDEEEY